MHHDHGGDQEPVEEHRGALLELVSLFSTYQNPETLLERLRFLFFFLFCRVLRGSENLKQEKRTKAPVHARACARARHCQSRLPFSAAIKLQAGGGIDRRGSQGSRPSRSGRPSPVGLLWDRLAQSEPWSLSEADSTSAHGSLRLPESA